MRDEHSERRPDAVSPPRLAERLVRWRLPGEISQSVAGDLEEEYRERIRPAHGRLRADLWYWAQALLLPAAHLRRIDRRLAARRVTQTGCGRASRQGRSPAPGSCPYKSPTSA
jgi:hypothetical protein